MMDIKHSRLKGAAASQSYCSFWTHDYITSSGTDLLEDVGSQEEGNCTQVQAIAVNGFNDERNR